MAPYRSVLPALALLFTGLAACLAATPAAQLVSITASGLASGNAASKTSDQQRPSRRLVSQDGRYVVFISRATDLTGIADGNGDDDVFRRDLSTGNTDLVSVNQAGNAAGKGRSSDPSLSADGRFVCFLSRAVDLTPGVQSDTVNVYARDLVEHKTVLVSASPDGAGGDAPSLDPVVTPDGRFVAFGSIASNLVSGFTKGLPGVDMYVRDLQAVDPTKATELMSIIPSQPGASSTGACDGAPAISADGRYVAFASGTGFLANDHNGAGDVFVRDRATKTTELVTVNRAGTGSASDNSGEPVMSGDGRFVAFISQATDLVTGPSVRREWNVFVRDRTARTTVLGSINSAGTADGNGASQGPVISADGRYVAFISQATDLAAGVPDANNVFDVLVRDLQAGSTVLASVNRMGTGAGLGQSTGPALSDNGQYVAFASDASNLVSNDANGNMLDVFRRDLTAKQTELISLNTTGVSGNGHSGLSPTGISGDGSLVFFGSVATDFDGRDRNSLQDVFAARPETAPPVDLTSPVVTPTNLTASGGRVTLSVHASSPSAISSVYATVLPPAGGAVNVALAHGTGTLYSGSYTALGNGTFKAQTYAVSFTGKNAAGGQATISGSSITVAGKPVGAKPVITSCTVSPLHLPYLGGQLTVTASVTAANGVKRVDATAYVSPVSPVLGSLTHTTGNTYSGTMTLPRNPYREETGINVTLTAEDQAGLLASRPCSGASQDGNGGPVITNCETTPSTIPYGGGDLTISAKVTAGRGVDHVSATIFRGGAYYAEFALGHLAGSRYSGAARITQNPLDADQSLSVTITAFDKLGVSNSTLDCPSAMQASSLPIVLNCDVSPKHLPATGGTLEITAKVSAPAGIREVIAHLQSPGDGLGVDMRRGHRGRFHASVRFGGNSQREPKLIEVNVEVFDKQGRSATGDCGTVTQSGRRARR